MIGTILEIIYGEEMSSAKIGYNGVINILEITIGTRSSHYDICYSNNTTESIYDIRRVIKNNK